MHAREWTAGANQISWYPSREKPHFVSAQFSTEPSLALRGLSSCFGDSPGHRVLPNKVDSACLLVEPVDHISDRILVVQRVAEPCGSHMNTRWPDEGVLLKKASSYH